MSSDESRRFVNRALSLLSESGPIQIPANKPLHTNQNQENAKITPSNNASLQKPLAFNLSYHPEHRYIPDNTPSIQFKQVSNINQNKPQYVVSNGYETYPLLDSESYEHFPSFINNFNGNYGAKW